MLSRDFTKPKKEYLFKNKFVIIAIAVVLFLSIVMTAVFGFNTTPEFDGGYMFSIEVGKDLTNSNISKYTDKIDNILDDNNLELYSVQYKGEGELASLQVRYMGDITVKKATKINTALAKYFEIDITNVSSHEFIQPTILNSDYIYTALAILLIILASAIFVIFRHNIGYAISLLGSAIFSGIGIILTYGLLQLKVTSSIFTILLLTVAFTLLNSLLLFETMKKVARKAEYKNDLSKTLIQGMKENAKGLEFSAIALFVIGIILVMFGSTITRQIAIGYLFGIVISLVSFMFILPLIYNLTMDKVKINKRVKQEQTNQEDKKSSVKNEKLETNEQEKETEVVETVSENTDEVVMDKADNTTSSNSEN